jgi:predicted  nucleic acid-binding Zn-ribbon protein
MNNKKYTYNESKEFFKKQNLLLLDSNYKNVHTKMKYKCLKCGYIGKKTLKNVMLKQGCQKCSGVAKYKISEVKKIFLKNNLLLLDKKYINYLTKMNYRCLKCGYYWKISLFNIRNGNGCPKCSSFKREKDVIKILEKIYPNYKLDIHNRKLLNGLEGDIIIHEINTIFEINGKQHYEFHPYYHHTYDVFEKIKKNDKLKQKIAKQKNYKLIVIPYWIKNNNVENYLLKCLF